MWETSEHFVLYLIVALDPRGAPFAMRIENKSSQSSAPLALEMLIDKSANVLGAMGARTWTVSEERLLRVFLMLRVRGFCLRRPAESCESDEALFLFFGDGVLVYVEHGPGSVEGNAFEIVILDFG